MREDDTCIIKYDESLFDPVAPENGNEVFFLPTDVFSVGFPSDRREAMAAPLAVYLPEDTGWPTPLVD